MRNRKKEERFWKKQQAEEKKMKREPSLSLIFTISHRCKKCGGIFNHHGLGFAKDIVETPWEEKERSQRIGQWTKFNESLYQHFDPGFPINLMDFRFQPEKSFKSVPVRSGRVKTIDNFPEFMSCSDCGMSLEFRQRADRGKPEITMRRSNKFFPKF